MTASGGALITGPDAGRVAPSRIRASGGLVSVGFVAGGFAAGVASS